MPFPQFGYRHKHSITAVAPTFPNNASAPSFIRWSDSGQSTEALSAQIYGFPSRFRTSTCSSLATMQSSCTYKRGISTVALTLPNDTSILPLLSWADRSQLTKALSAQVYHCSTSAGVSCASTQAAYRYKRSITAVALALPHNTTLLPLLSWADRSQLSEALSTQVHGLSPRFCASTGFSVAGSQTGYWHESSIATVTLTLPNNIALLSFLSWANRYQLSEALSC